MSRVERLLRRYNVAGNPLLSERRVEFAALVLTIFVVLQLLYSVVRLFVPSHPELILPSAESLLVSDLQRAGIVSAQHRNEVIARPVFWPSRRPVEASMAKPAETEERKPKAKKSELDKVKLLGIFGVGDSAGVIALVKGSKRRILLGDETVGWTLESIEDGGASFVSDGLSQTLELVRGTQKVSAAAVLSEQRKATPRSQALIDAGKPRPMRVN